MFKNINWKTLLINLIKVVVGAIGGAIATTSSESVNECAYALKCLILNSIC